jgi:hypothetical protein
MNMALALTIITCLYGVIMPALSQPEGWRGLVPLHSTRADVERLLGAPTKSHGVASTYDTKEERVLVFYSGGSCKKGVSEEWNVPADTVLSITVHPNAKLLVDSLKLDKSKYRREGDPHADLIVYYVNKEEGIRVEARMLEEGEDVDNITYEAAAKDSPLRCRCN